MNAYTDPLRRGYLNREWQAFLHVNFRARSDRTYLAETEHKGPYVIQRPFYPEGEVCHVYLLHPPGGLVSGDHLRLQLHSHPDAHALITTPSAGKFYRRDTEQYPQMQTTHLKVEESATLEYLPQENIFFAGCHARMNIEMDISSKARFIGWETLCLGRPHSNEPMHSGEVAQRTRIRVDGENLFREHLYLPGDPTFLAAPWGLQGFQTLSTLFCIGLDEADFTPWQEALHQDNNQEARASATRIGPLTIVRLFAGTSEIAQTRLRAIWQQLRPLILGREAVPPRIWNT